MERRYLTILATAAALVAGILFTPKPAAAQQEQQYFTYVSEWAVPRAQWAAFEKEEESQVPTMRKLVADGLLVDWGSEAARVHQENGYTHSEWFTATSRANLLKALEILWKTATNASYVATTKHKDLFLHTIAHGGKPVSNGTGYLRVGFYQARPGDAEAFQGLLMTEVKPVLDSAVADGTLLMYNLDEEAIHTDAPGAYNIAMLFPSGAAMDSFFSNLAASVKAHPSLGALFDSLTIAKDHRDSLSRVTAYESK